jgi:hypothetical protein
VRNFVTLGLHWYSSGAVRRRKTGKSARFNSFHFQRLPS